MKRAIIFCSGDMDCDDVFLKEYEKDLILCADGGYRHAKRLGVTPNFIIGDLDSGITEYPQEISSRIYPSEKDATDTNLCLDYAIEQGCDEVVILGGIGGRLDHEFTHYALMLYGRNHGVRVVMIDGSHEIWMEEKPFTLTANEKRYISFFPFGGDVEDFTVQGLKYEASKIKLSCGTVQASSNQFDGAEIAQVSFREGGHVLVMRCSEK